MSKLVDRLNSINSSRRADDSIEIKEAQENKEQAPVVVEHSGIYFLGFLIVLLIGFSVFSMSISLKTLTQLESVWSDSKTMITTLNKQQADIKKLREFISDSSTEELARIESIENQFKDITVSIENSNDEVSKMKVAYRELKTSLQSSINELQLSDKLMLKKYNILNEQVEKINDENSLFLHMN